MRGFPRSDLTLATLSGTTKDMRLVISFGKAGISNKQALNDGFVFGLRQSETLGNFLYTGRQVFELNSYY
jgi:hypothetical protein